MIACLKCGYENIDEARFCVSCGASLKGWKGRVNALSQKIAFQTRQAIDKTMTSLDKQVSQYITQIEDKKKVRIAGVDIPESRQASVKNALVSFQNRFLASEPQVSKEYEIWASELQNRMEDQTCIVCFAKWKSEDEIVVCPNCNSGGHQTHLEGWIKDRQFCPLCRQTLRKTELVKIVM